MSRKPDLAYVANLTRQLMKAREDVKRLQAEYDALWFGSGLEANPISKARQPRLGTKVSKIIQFLQERVGQNFTSEEIDKELALGHAQSTATTLSKLLKKGTISKQGTDKYTWPSEQAEPVFQEETG